MGAQRRRLSVYVSGFQRDAVLSGGKVNEPATSFDAQAAIKDLIPLVQAFIETARGMLRGKAIGAQGACDARAITLFISVEVFVPFLGVRVIGRSLGQGNRDMAVDKGSGQAVRDGKDNPERERCAQSSASDAPCDDS